MCPMPSGTGSPYSRVTHTFIASIFAIARSLYPQALAGYFSNLVSIKNKGDKCNGKNTIKINKQINSLIKKKKMRGGEIAWQKESSSVFRTQWADPLLKSWVLILLVLWPWSQGFFLEQTWREKIKTTMR